MAGSRGDIKAGAAYVELFVKNSRFMKGLQDAKQRLSQFGADMQAFGRQLVAVSGAALVPLAFAAKTFADFDDAMRAVKGVTGAVEEDFRMLTDRAKELGRTTSFTAIEVASLMTELGRAGFNPSQIDAMTGSVLNLARATGTDATLASGIMAASIRQFGLEAGDAGRVSDGLTAAANKSFNTVEQLGEALSYAGPVAKDFNMSFEDTLAVLGGLGNVGIQASSAGTALRRLLVLNGAEAEKLRGIFGVSFLDAAGNARPLVDVLSEVNEATKDLGSGDRAAKFNEAFGLLGITGASAIGNAAGDIRKLAEEIKAAGGIAGDTAAEMDSGLGGSFRIFMSALEGVKIALGEALEGALGRVVNAGTKFMGMFTKIVGQNKDAVITFAKFALIIGGIGASLLAIGFGATFVSIAIGGLAAMISGIVGAITVAMSIAGGLFAILSSPITLVVVSLAGIAAAVIQATGAMNTLVGSAMRIRGQFVSLFAGLSQTFTTAFGGIRDALNAGELALAGQIAVTALKLAMMQGLETIGNLLGGLWGQTLAKLTSQMTGGDFSGAWTTIVVGMSSVWESFSSGIVTVFVGASKAVIGVWRATVDSLTNYLLQRAGEGGIFGAFLESISGVNVKDEIERNQKLKSQEGVVRENIQNEIIAIETELKVAVDQGDEDQIALLNEQLEAMKGNLADLDGTRMPDIFDQVAAGNFTDPATQAIADQLNAGLDALQAQSDANVDAAEQALAAATAENKPSAEIAKLQEELEALRAKAQASADKLNNPDADETEPGTPGKPGARGVGPGGAGEGGPASVGIATTSFAAAAAQAQGGSFASQTLAEIKAMKEEMKQRRIEAREQAREQREAERRNQGVFV